MQFEKAYSFFIKKLDKELSDQLYYHNVEHTRDVIKAAEHLAKAENINAHDLHLLKTAALFHDAGFLELYKGHEEVSCRLAKEILPQFGYTSEQIEQICQLISATKLPQSPKNKLAEILCDADLYYLGTDDFSEKAEGLFKERQNQGLLKNHQQWNQEQSKFLKSHAFFTTTAKEQLNKKKQNHLAHLQEMVGFAGMKKKSALFNFVTDSTYIILGVISAAFALKSFLVPNNFYDGGVTGISLLIHEIYHFDLSFVIAIVNVPFIVMGIYVINFKFAIKSILCIVLLGVALHYLHFPHITSDKLLVAVFGGFFLGIGSGLVMRAGSAIDGSEILALYTFRRTNFTMSEIILGLNIIIFSFAAYKFGIEVALYSLMTYFTASKTIDYVIEGVEAYQGVTIISGKSEIIKDQLVNTLGRGITIYKGERGFLPGNFEVSEKVDIIFTVITRLELRKLKKLVAAIDPAAFIFANPVKDAFGGIIKKRATH